MAGQPKAAKVDVGRGESGGDRSRFVRRFRSSGVGDVRDMGNEGGDGSGGGKENGGGGPQHGGGSSTGRQWSSGWLKTPSGSLRRCSSTRLTAELSKLSQSMHDDAGITSSSPAAASANLGSFV